MSAPTPLRRFQTTYAIDRWADLDFRVSLPESWNVELPQAQPTGDLEADPLRLLPLLAAGTKDGSVTFDIAARPAHPDHAVADSAERLLCRQRVDIEHIDGERPLGMLAAVSGHGWQAAAGGERRIVHFAFVEDGRRLMQLLLVGTVAQVEALHSTWSTLLRSFHLERSRGATVPVQTPRAQVPGVARCG